MKNVLITGGAGFIGSQLAHRLVDRNDHVVVVDNLSTGKRESVPSQAEFIELDLATPAFAAVLPAAPFDAVCHLAAQSSGYLSGQNPYYDLQANAASTLQLSSWCLQKGIPRFLYASSMAAYGNVAKLPVSEDEPGLPVSYYGVSKLASEHLLRLASREGLSVTSFRMFSVYGPGQNLANLHQGMVSIFLAYLLNGSEVPVTGSCDRFRDFVYIDDVLDAWISALDMHCTPAPTYNIGCGYPVTVRHLLDALIAAVGTQGDPVVQKAGSQTDQFGLYADITRAKADLKWSPSTGLATGIGQMVKWARQSGIST